MNNFEKQVIDGLARLETNVENMKLGMLDKASVDSLKSFKKTFWFIAAVYAASLGFIFSLIMVR